MLNEIEMDMFKYYNLQVLIIVSLWEGIDTVALRYLDKIGFFINIIKDYCFEVNDRTVYCSMDRIAA